MPFADGNQWQTAVDNVRNKIIKIKLQYLKDIYSKLKHLLENADEKINITYLIAPHYVPRATYNEKNPETKKPELLALANNVGAILNKSTDEYFYQYLIKLFNDSDNCKDYALLNKYIFTSNVIQISSPTTSIDFDYVILFKKINDYINTVHFSYDF